MNPISLILFLTLISLFTFDDASAFYNPQPGRWLSRDPIAESGFGLENESKRNANKHILDYAFVVNSPTAYWDYLGLDNPGCDLPGWLLPDFNRDCYLRCCAIHDKCYYNKTFKDGTPCNKFSWLQLLNPCSWCGGCNRDVLGCFLGCSLGDDMDPGPMWFCPNGPNAGTTYFNWDSIPADCWKDGVKPDQP